MTTSNSADSKAAFRRYQILTRARRVTLQLLASTSGVLAAAISTAVTLRVSDIVSSDIFRDTVLVAVLASAAIAAIVFVTARLAIVGRMLRDQTVDERISSAYLLALQNSTLNPRRPHVR